MLAVSLLLALSLSQTGQLVSGFCPAGVGCPKVSPIKILDDGTVVTSGGGGGGGLVDQGLGGLSPWLTYWTSPGPVTQSGAWSVSILGTVPVSGPLTDAQLRATPVPVSGTVAVSGTVPVSGPLTDTQLRATPVPVSGPLTDTQLRATAVPVSGPLTDAQLSARVNTLGQKTMANSTPVAIASDQGALSIFNGTADAGNSSTATLAAAGVFTGVALNVFNQTTTQVYIFSNVSSAANGVSLQYSSNGTNWDEVYTTTYTAGANALVLTVPVRGQFFRIVYTNGGTLQASFRLYTIHKLMPFSGDVVELSDVIRSADHAQVTRAMLTALTPTPGVYGEVITHGTDTDAEPTRTVGALEVDSHGRVFNGTTYDRWYGGGTNADAVATTTLGSANERSFLFGFNGTTWDRVRTANTGRLQTDVVTAPPVASSTTASATNTGTCTSVTVSATVLAANATRKAATIYNSVNSTDNVHVKLGATATTSNPPLAPGQSLTIDANTVYTGVVDAIAATGTQSVCVYEW